MDTKSRRLSSPNIEKIKDQMRDLHMKDGKYVPTIAEDDDDHYYGGGKKTKNLHRMAPVRRIARGHAPTPIWGLTKSMLQRLLILLFKPYPA